MLNVVALFRFLFQVKIGSQEDDSAVAHIRAGRTKKFLTPVCIAPHRWSLEFAYDRQFLKLHSPALGTLSIYSFLTISSDLRENEKSL